MSPAVLQAMGSLLTGLPAELCTRPPLSLPPPSVPLALIFLESLKGGSEDMTAPLQASGDREAWGSQGCQTHKPTSRRWNM